VRYSDSVTLGFPLGIVRALARHAESCPALRDDQTDGIYEALSWLRASNLAGEVLDEQTEQTKTD
jgi:hypothetical protein